MALFFRNNRLRINLATMTLATLAGIFSFNALPANAQPAGTLLKTIPNPVPRVGDNFARNLMVTKDDLILAGGRDGGGSIPDSGALYLIDSNGDIQVTMPNPGPETNVGFGAFAWSGETRLVASAFLKNEDSSTSSGRVYIFDLATGQYDLTIDNPTPGTDEEFGYGLGMLGDTAIISSRGDDTAGNDAGIVYLYDSLNGALLRTIVNPEPTTQDNFGYSVAGIGTNKILIGVPNSDVGATDAGAAYVFAADSGSQLLKIVNPDPVNGAFFGFQVRSHGDDLLVGAPGNNKAYLFDGETGDLLQRFENPDLKPGAVFGSTVASVGANVLVGNPYEPFSDQTLVGRAYLFSGETGALLMTLNNPTPENLDRFGVSVAGLAGNLVVSADQDRVDDQLYAGSVYIFQGFVAACSGEWNLYQ